MKSIYGIFIAVRGFHPWGFLSGISRMYWTVNCKASGSVTRIRPCLSDDDNNSPLFGQLLSWKMVGRGRRRRRGNRVKLQLRQLMAGSTATTLQ